MLSPSLRRGSLIVLFTCLLTACPGAKKTESVAPAPEAKPAAEAPKVEAAPPPAKTEDPAKPSAAGNFSSPVDAVKAFYDSVNNESFDVAWAALTKKSQDKIVSMVASDEKMDPVKVRSLFDNNDASIRLGFWTSFKNSSKVSEFAPAAVYKVTTPGDDQAVVQLTNKLVVLDSKAFKEGGQWKMGYVETFLPDK